MKKIEAIEILQKRIDLHINKIKKIFGEPSPEDKLLIAIFGEKDGSKGNLSPYVKAKKYYLYSQVINSYESLIKEVVTGTFDNILVNIQTEKQLFDKLPKIKVLGLLQEDNSKYAEYQILLEAKEEALSRLKHRTGRISRMTEQNAPVLVIENEARMTEEATNDVRIILSLLEVFAKTYPEVIENSNQRL